jgi:hemerythrin
MISWTPALAVGIEEIDAQHQELFRRAEGFIAGLAEPTRRDVGLLLSYLRLYCVTHFGAEEEWMREVGYADYPRHKAEHDAFIGLLLQLSREHERPPGLEPLRVGTWLQRWLEDHVSGTDVLFARFVLARAG